MVEAARTAHPELTFVLGDAQTMTLDMVGGEPFDAAFSNAALHWMTRGDLAAAAVRGVLRAGARFAAELGGVGNVAAIDAALRAALSDIGIHANVQSNTFPSVALQASWLEAAGFRVRLIRWYERPTQLQDGASAADWTRHFRAATWAAVPGEAVADLAEAVNRHAADQGLRAGGWFIDYRRLQFLAEAL